MFKIEIGLDDLFAMIDNSLEILKEILKVFCRSSIKQVSFIHHHSLICFRPEYASNICRCVLNNIQSIKQDIIYNLQRMLIVA